MKPFGDWEDRLDQIREVGDEVEESAGSRITYYTDAPEAYDSFGTKTLAIVGRNPRNRNPVRKVSTPTEHYDWQVTLHSD